MDFDQKRDCYLPDVKEFVFDLEVMRNIKGDLIDKEEKTPEQLAESEFQNQVYERLFQRIEAEMMPNPDDEESDESLDLPKSNIRENWIKQQRYLKFQKQAGFLWDAFTSGNANEKNKKLKEQEENEEKAKED